MFMVSEPFAGGGEPSLHGENQLVSPAQPFSVSKYRVKQIFKKEEKPFTSSLNIFIQKPVLDF
jgi:hypothetical protein